MDPIDKEIYHTLFRNEQEVLDAVDPMDFFSELGNQGEWFDEMYVNKPSLYDEWKSVGGKDEVLINIYIYGKSKDFNDESIIRLIKKYIEIRREKYKEPIPPMSDFVFNKMKEIIDKRVKIKKKFFTRSNSRGGRKSKKEKKKSKKGGKTKKSKKKK